LAAGPRQADDGDNQMNQKHSQIAHFGNLTRISKPLISVRLGIRHAQILPSRAESDMVCWQHPKRGEICHVIECIMA
jgi:hypothetical protein